MRGFTLFLIFCVSLAALYVVGVLAFTVAYSLPLNTSISAAPGFSEASSEALASGVAPIKALLFGTSGNAIDESPDNPYFKALLACVIFAATQVLFIAPLVGPLRLGPTGRSLHTTVIGASFFAGLLTAAIAWSMVDALGALGSDGGGGSGYGRDGPPWLQWILFSWIVCGAVWTAVLWRAGESRDPDGIARIARRLLAGTGLELLLSLPIMAMLRMRTPCLCITSGFWAFVLGLCGLFWLCGPWLVLLLTAESRRAWRAAACPGCGARAPTAGGTCGSCGATVPARVQR